MKNEEKNYITLQQFLKVNDIVQSGGEAKMMIQNGKIHVNGEIEERRGRKLYEGDSVMVLGKKYIVKG